MSELNEVTQEIVSSNVNDLELQNERSLLSAKELVRRVREEAQNSKNKEGETKVYHFSNKYIDRIIDVTKSVDRDNLRRWIINTNYNEVSNEYKKALLDHINSSGIIFLDINELSVVIDLIRIDGVCDVLNSPSEYISQLIGDANFFSPCQARHGFPEASSVAKRLLKGISFMGQDYYEELLDPSFLEPGEAEDFLARKENHETEVVSMIIESCHPAILDALFKELRKQYRALGPIETLPSFAQAARMKHPCFQDSESVAPSVGTQNI